MNTLQHTSRRSAFVALLVMMAGIALVGAPRPAMAQTVSPAHTVTVARFYGPPFGGMGFGQGFGSPFFDQHNRFFNRRFFFDRDDRFFFNRRFFFDRDDRRFFFDRDDRFFNGSPFFGQGFGPGY